MVSAASASDLGYWKLGGVVVSLKNGVALRGHFRWLEYHEPRMAESLPATLRRLHRITLGLDTALVGVQYPDTCTVVTTAAPISIWLDSIASVAAAPSPLDGREGYNTPPVMAYQAELLQTKPYAMCSGVTDSGSKIWWLSYYSWIRLADLKPLCSEPLVGVVRPGSGGELIRLVFYSD
jgi:hypothetical protein